MEHWQITHITCSLPDLISFTDCNTTLLAQLQAAALLADADVEAIRAERNKHDKAYLLYAISQTKVNGYHSLIKALIATKQSGAAKVLLQLPPAKIGSLQVSLQDVIYLVSDLLSQDEIEEISLWIRNNLSMDKCLNIHERIEAAETLELVRDTIPKPQKLYIPRLLSCRLGVNPDLFEKPCTDIFVFKEIEQPQLRNFVKSYTIALSSEQLLQRNITSRFLLLDGDNDWSRIRISAKSPVHLMKYNKCKQTFLLEATTGDTSALRSYLQYHGEQESHYVSEDAFIEIASSDTGRGICICDSPGMGKSLLLASIASNVRIKWPERMVGFIQLQNLVTRKGMLDDVTLKILELICTSSLASQIIYKLYKRNEIQLELFFDGLDEVQHENLDSTTTFLKKICEDMPNVKVYVTSRPVVRAELENAMGMIAYDILPFNKKTQISYLTKYWAQIAPTADTKKLSEYAEYCIQGLKQTLKHKDKNIAGVPLMCWLLAEVYTGKAITYADTTRVKDVKLPDKFVSSLYEIYEKYLSRQLGKTECKFACMYKSDFDKTLCSSACRVKSFHVWLAHKLVVPKYSVKLEKIASRFENLPPFQILAPGVLDKGQQFHEYVFTHRTFAEYLVAEYFANNFLWELCKLRTTQLSPQINYLGLNAILITDKIRHDECFLKKCYHSKFRENVVVYFLDAMISQNCENATLTNASISPFNISFFQWLEGCLLGNLPGLISWLIQISTKPQAWTMHVYHKVLYAIWRSCNQPITNVLDLAANYSNKETVENLFQFFKKVFNPDLTKANHYDKALSESVKIATARGDYELVRYLIQTFPFTLNPCVFSSWVRYCRYDRMETKQETFEILDFYLANNSSLLEEKLLFETPLLWAVRFRHLEAIKFLLLREANVFAVDSNGSTILHIAAIGRDDEFFLEIVRILGQKWIKFQTNASLNYSGPNRVPENIHEPTSIKQLFNWPTKPYQQTPLHYAVRWLRDMQLETLDLLLAGGNETKVEAQQFTCVNFDAVDIDGETALHYALVCQRLELVKHLIARGADWTLKPKHGCNAVHICAHRGSEQHLKYFLELGCMVNELDLKGNNALQCALDHRWKVSDERNNFDISKAKILIDAGVNISNKNLEGKTAGKLAFLNGWPEEIVKLL